MNDRRGQRILNGIMGIIVIVAYRAKPEKEAAFLEVLRDHLPILQREGFATGRAPIVMRAKNGTIVEVFEWKSQQAIDAAHQNARVREMWRRFSAACDFANLKDLEESGTTFAHFEPVDL